MPIFYDTDQVGVDANGYGFSGARVEKLAASEYTLVVIAADVSGSVYSFQREIEDCISAIVQACQAAPHGDNLLLRIAAFDDVVQEVHGFKPLMECAPASYRGALRAGGTTALYDAACNAVDSLVGYGQRLRQHGFEANAILFVITDGSDNASTLTAKRVGAAMTQAVTGESVESMLSILVGVNVQNSGISGHLMDFSTKAGFTQYVELGDATAATLAKLATFASRSIALQSRALGSASASRPLTF